MGKGQVLAAVLMTPILLGIVAVLAVPVLVVVVIFEMGKESAPSRSGW